MPCHSQWSIGLYLYHLGWRVTAICWGHSRPNTTDHLRSMVFTHFLRHFLSTHSKIEMGHCECTFKLHLVSVCPFAYNYKCFHSEVTLICVYESCKWADKLFLNKLLIGLCHESLLVFAAAWWWGVPLPLESDDEGSTDWWKTIVASGLWVTSLSLLAIVSVPEERDSYVVDIKLHKNIPENLLSRKTDSFAIQIWR